MKKNNFSMDAAEAIEKFKEYSEHVTISDAKNSRYIYDLGRVREFSRELADTVLRLPFEILPFVEEEMRESALIKHIGFEGAFGRHLLTPRTLSSTFLSQMICIEGIVTSASLVRPKITRSVHYAIHSNEFLAKNYRDATMMSKLPPTNTVYPNKDSKGNIVSTEYGLSDYIDFQTLTLQEMPENAPPGQLPRSIEIVVSDDLVDSAKPGDRVRVYGVYKSIVPLSTGFPGFFRTVIIANNIKPIISTVTYNYEQKKIEMLAQSNLRFSSIAPSIFGLDPIKKAVLMQMVGGNEIVMRNGSRIRGDINILMVGDPSTAKSQILRYCLEFAPLAVATTGRGSSGVGLTAAVVVDKETGDRRLEAGAMVLADGGLVCIDEFDKMDENDRVAIHEAMEQQTVSIAKAGIHATLNARCAVLAAANPVFGSYDERRIPSDNVRLPESLMTRFDLVFVTIDKSNEENDTRISKHVLKSHLGEKSQGEVSQNLLKEFVAYAKRLRPALTREAASLVSKEYVKLRSQKNSKHLVVTVTPRLLETMIRLSTAHAKLRLSEVVEESDVAEVVQMVTDSIFKKPIKRKDAKKFKVNEPVLGDEVLETDVDAIKEAIWEWRSKNNNNELDIAEIKGFNKKDVENVAEELAAQEIIVYEDGKIYFLD